MRPLRRSRRRVPALRSPGVFLLLAVAATPATAERFDEALYAQLLRRHTRQVSDRARVRVDYSGLARSADWRRLIASLERTDPEKLSSRSERLAFWINAYNVLAMELVVQNYPVESIRDIGSLWRPVWRREAGRIGGKPVSLDQIEHGILRPLLEPRIHAAIVCASVSCPDLRREPWRATALHDQFDDAMKTWMADPERGSRIDAAQGTIYLSKIFDWFAEDFASRGGVLAFLTPYLDDAARAWLKRNPHARIRYLEYDWSLNDLAEERSDRETDAPPPLGSP